MKQPGKHNTLNTKCKIMSDIAEKYSYNKLWKFAWLQFCIRICNHPRKKVPDADNINVQFFTPVFEINFHNKHIFSSEKFKWLLIFKVRSSYEAHVLDRLTVEKKGVLWDKNQLNLQI